jgi:predicted DsbA family dithiol-disulfide isomerase
MASENRVQITHYSDVLCVWAYVSQIRCDELLERFPDQTSIDCRYFHVFGDVAGKMEASWSTRGGLAAYAEHVKGVAEDFPHVEVHDDVWLRRTPRSSMPAHLVLCAVRGLVADDEAETGSTSRSAWAIRLGFFRDALDVSRRQTLLELVEAQGLSAAAIEARLDDGRAHATLAADLDEARKQGIDTSPSLVFNEGRQRLAGNVGYRILEANVRELLERPGDQRSWC